MLDTQTAGIPGEAEMLKLLAQRAAAPAQSPPAADDPVWPTCQPLL